MNLRDGESRKIAIAVPFQTSFVVAFVLGVAEHFGFRSSQF